jgi:hypothetical protein
MSWDKERFLVLVALIIAAAFLVIVAIPAPRQSPSNAGKIEVSSSTGGGGSNIPSNAFLPQIPFIGGGIYNPRSASASDNSIKGEQPNSGFQTYMPPLGWFKEATPPAASPQQEEALLSLPVVPDSELLIASSGVTNAQNYLDYFAKREVDIAFDYSKFKDALKDEKGILLLTPSLVEMALSRNDFAKVHNSLSIQKEFLEAKIRFLKTIKVSGEAIALNKKMIAFDELTLELIGKTFSAENGELSASDLKDFLTKYLATAKLANEQFIQSSNLLGFKFKDNFFYRLAKLFGLSDEVIAQGFLFGGLITFTTPCDCPPTGIQIVVGPPVGGTFYLTTPFMASPLFFPFRSPHVGAYILGLYSTAPLPCHTLPFCVVLFPPVTLAGTSE